MNPGCFSNIIGENEDPAKTRLGDITIEELEALRKRTEENFSKMNSISNEDGRLLKQLNSKKKYYGVRDEETTISASSAMDITFALMRCVLNAEKPDATPEDKNIYQIMRNLFGVYKIMRDSFVSDDEK